MNPILDESSQPELFQRISDICVSVNVVKNTRELLESSLKQVMALFGAKRGSIFIMNENRRELVLKMAYGMKVAEQEKMVKRLGEGVVGRVAEIKKPVIVEDIARDGRFQDFKARRSYRSPSFICAPLLIKDKLIGVINIADKESGRHFTRDELQLLDFLSSQIALNYRRIQLYQKFKNILKESKSLKSELGKSSAEASHLKKQIEVQEKFASIGKLAGGIAHEFNNPLDGVIRYTNLSLEQLKDNEVVHGYLLEIKHGLNRMTNIVKSLLACSRNTRPSMQTIEVNAKIEQALHGLQSDFCQKEIALEKKLGVHIPPFIDLGIDLIVSNLVRNSIYAVEKKGKIKVSTGFGNGLLTIKVQDNGSGIPPEQADQIFDPFFTTKDIEKGCGLGLTIVSEVVKTYGGTIHFESVLKSGTIFTVILPFRSSYAEKN